MTLNEIIEQLRKNAEELKNDHIEIEKAISLYKESKKLIKLGNEIIEQAQEEIDKINNEEK